MGKKKQCPVAAKVVATNKVSVQCQVTNLPSRSLSRLDVMKYGDAGSSRFKVVPRMVMTETLILFPYPPGPGFWTA
jgi:hypothetical protein